MRSHKVCIIGDAKVGKTSLIRRFVSRKFGDRYLSTIGVSISAKTICIRQETVKLILWDIEGSRKFQPMVVNYLQGSSAVIVVADLSRPPTVDLVPEYLDLAASAKLRDVRATIVAFNKSDLIDRNDLDAFLRDFQLPEQYPTTSIFTTSAKSGENVQLLFEYVAGQIVPAG